jgi:tetratricopeptide (TPR) repeat protein
VDFLKRPPNLVAIFILVGVTALVYVNSLPNAFHYDDFHGIVRNPAIKDWRNVPSYFTDASTYSLAHRSDWRPVLQITFALNFALGGPAPVYFRLVNLAFHIAAVIFVYLVVAETSKTLIGLPEDAHARVPGTAFVAAALFAVHPVNSEVVNYVWARSSLLAALFYLVAFYCLLRGPFGGKKKRRAAWHVAGLAAYGLGLATKATVITLPATLFLHECLRSPEAGVMKSIVFVSSRLKKFIPILALTVGYLVLRAVLITDSFLGVVRAGEVSSSTYLLSSLRAWIYYLRLFLWPSPLLVNYHGFGWSYSLLDGRVLLSIGLILTILSLAWRLRESAPVVTFFACWFFIALLPESSFFPLSEPINGYRPYLANVGVSVSLVGLTLRGLSFSRDKSTGGATKYLARNCTVYGFACGLLLGVLALSTIRRNLDWRTESSLWSDVLKKDPDNPRAHMSLGLHFLERKEYFQAGDMFEKAVALSPQNSYVYLLRGYLNLLLGKNPEALEDLTRAIGLEPRSPYYFYYRGEVYADLGQYENALDDYRRALTLKRHFTDAHFGTARVHRQKGEIVEAAKACHKVLEVDRFDIRA